MNRSGLRTLVSLLFVVPLAFGAPEALATGQRPSARQAPLVISNSITSVEVGTAITLTTSGGSGTGAVTFSARGSGCSVSGTQLTASRATSCSVTARKAASTGYSSTNSGAKSFSFIAVVRAFNGRNCTILGTTRADTLTGTAGDDVICGLGGNDRISGLGGNDVIDGGAGNDWISAGLGADLVAGGAGTDTINGDGGGDLLSGGDDADTISGGTQLDICQQDPADVDPDCESTTTTPIFEGKLLSGTAYRTDGLPVVGAKIEVGGNTGVDSLTYTDDSGYYQVLLPVGDGYRLTMTWLPEGDQPFPSFVEGGYSDIDVDTDTVVNLEIPMPNEVTVHVDDDRGDPIEGATVRTYPGTGSGVPSGPGTSIALDWFRYHTSRSTTTNAYGDATLWLYDGGSPINIETFFVTPEGVTARRWIENVVIDGDMTLTAELETSVSTVSGRVTRYDGTGVEGVKIELTSGETQSSAAVFTDADGYYEASVTPGGDYTFWLNWLPAASEEYPWKVVSITNGIVLEDDTTINVPLPRPNRVRVNVTDLNGNPLEGAVVRTTIGSTEGGYSELPGTIVSLGAYSGQRRTTDADGAAYLWLFPASYSPYTLVEYTLPDGTLIRKQVEVEVEDGWETTVVLPTSTVVFSGTVKRSDGVAIVGAEMHLSSGDTGADVKVRTDETGTFRASVPAGGDYRVWMTWQPGSSEPFPAKIEAYRHPVEFRRNTTINFTVPLPRKVTVLVTDRNDRPLRGAIVTTGVGSQRGIDPPPGSGFSAIMFYSGQSSTTGSDGKGYLYLYDFPYAIDAYAEYRPSSGSITRVGFDVMVSGDTSTTVRFDRIG